MEQLPALGTAIATLVAPTTKIYGQLLSKKADAILKTKKTTSKYGPHQRHQLDVYYPTDESGHDDAPVLLFVHGGGLVRGDRVIPTEPTEGLVYTNLGHYFAETCGYITVIMSYRLVFQHDAKFPSGGEDVGLAVQWIKDHLSTDGKPRDLFVMGQSAGAVHAATWMFAPPFETALATVTGDLKRQPVKLRGVVFVNGPLYFPTQSDHPAREEMLETYYGQQRAENGPLGLLKDLQEKNPNSWPLGNVEFLVIDAELDPEDEIRSATTDFLAQWLKGGPAAMKDKITYRELAGHNHVSGHLALGTGIEKEEALGGEVSGFIDSIRRREQLQKDIDILKESAKYFPPDKGGSEGAKEDTVEKA